MNLIIKSAFFLTILTIASCSSLKKSDDQILGFAHQTIGGKAGRIVYVTNLKNSGDGSLRKALKFKGPKKILFKISGIIKLKDNLVIKYPFLSVIGESAPSPGITLVGAGIVIKTHEVIISHLRIRVGDKKEGPAPDDRDGIQIIAPKIQKYGKLDIHNIVLRNLSISWAIDENISTWGKGGYRLRNITIQNSIISEALKCSKHSKGRHSMGLLIGDLSKNISIIGNVFAHNYGRNPLLKSGSSSEVVGNLIYNPGQEAIEFSNQLHTKKPIKSSILNNLFIPGKNTKHKTSHIRFSSRMKKGTEIYISGNSSPGINKKGNKYLISPKSKCYKNNIKFINDTPLLLSKASLSKYKIQNIKIFLKTKGARPWDRDTTDNRIISEIVNRSGSHINTPPKNEFSY